MKPNKFDQLVSVWPGVMIAAAIFVFMFFVALNVKYPSGGPEHNFTKAVAGNLSYASQTTVNALARASLKNPDFWVYWFPLIGIGALLIKLNVDDWIWGLIFGKKKDKLEVIKYNFGKKSTKEVKKNAKDNTKR